MEKFQYRLPGELTEERTESIKKGHRIDILVLAVFSILFLTAAVVVCFWPYLRGYDRQHQEEKIAIDYIQAMLDQKEVQAENSSIDWELIRDRAEQAGLLSEESEEEEESDAEQETWRDDIWYSTPEGITYTPDYAAGTIVCVLYIPTIQLCRGVYTGTWAEIYHNLDYWMVTAARPDYILGETHYCIYGHNTPRLNLSFNRLQSLTAGDDFYLLAPSGAYHYQVTGMSGVSREDSSHYTDDFTRKKEKCYLITCGRGEYQYLNLIVEGTLVGIEDIHTIEQQVAGRK